MRSIWPRLKASSSPARASPSRRARRRRDDGAARAGAAHEVARGLARPAVARDLHAGDPAKQVLDRIGAAVPDRLGVDDDDVGIAAAQGLRLARRGDGDGIEARLRQDGEGSEKEEQAKRGHRRAQARCEGSTW
jgi:hypothetical protein